jgi:hypothetical protein
MQYPALIVWHKGQEATISSSAELAAALGRFEQESLADPDSPLLAEIIDREGHCLTIGIAAQGAYVEFVSKELHENKHYTDLVCVGNGDAEGTVDFLWLGHHSELSCRHLVPVAVMKETVQHFLETGVLWDHVKWELV